ncbi:MAG: SMC-Scp complex subunit ScpB [Patescibacteria group bacterium]
MKTMSDILPNSSRIEALLFYKGEPVTLRFISSALNISEEEASLGVDALEKALLETSRGIVLMKKGNEIMLAATPAMGSVIEGIIKEEISKDLGKAGLETLAIVLYRGPIARSEVNYIRGVNSNYILRSLLVRGLIEKDESSSSRSIIYQPTFELLSYLGISTVKDLPEYDVVESSVKEFKDREVAEEGEGDIHKNQNGSKDEIINEKV